MQSPKNLRVIVVTARKGGVGKSTIACHLSVCAGPKTVLIDTDEQADEGSSATWMQSRESDQPRFYSHSDYVRFGIEKLLARAESEGAEYVIVDTPPKASAQISELMRIACVNILVTEPSFLALSALPRSMEIARAAGRPTLIVINKIKESRLEAEQTRQALGALGVPVAECGDLTDFGRALASGQAVREFAPKGKASAQIEALWAKVQEVMQ